MESNELLAGKNINQTLHYLEAAKRELSGAQVALRLIRKAKALAALKVETAEQHLMILQITEMQKLAD